MLEQNPKSPTGLVQKGALIGWLGHTLQEEILNLKRRLTEEERQKLELYKMESDKYIGKAMSLGWEGEAQKSRERYLQTVMEAKAMNSK